MKGFENAMAAVAFAEAGEAEMARSFMGPAGTGEKKVVLSVSDPEIKPKLISYALDLCQRVGGRLEVLHVLKPVLNEKSTRMTLVPLAEELNSIGVGYRLAFGDGNLEDEVIKNTTNMRNILLVVLKSIAQQDQLQDRDNVNVLRLIDRLKCPVVVFSDKL